MKDIIEFINNQRNCKFDDLQFFSAKFKKAKNSLQVIFTTPIFETYDENKIENLRQIVYKYIENRCTVEIKLKKLTISKDLVINLTKNLLNQNPLYSIIFDAENFSVELSDNKIVFIFSVDKSGLKSNEQENFEKLLHNTFAPYNVTDIICEYRQLDKDFASVLNLRKSEIENEIVESTESLNLSFVKDYLGEMKQIGQLLLPEQVLANMRDIFVCGTISNVTEHTRKKGDTDIESKFYKFTLSSLDSQISSVCFLKKGEDLLNLEQNQKVVVCGDCDEFNGSISLRIKSLSLCKFEFPKRKEKVANKTYKLIKPEKYIQKEQISFLETKELITSKYLLDNTFVVFDLETTGLTYLNCKIIEIGAVKIVNGQIVEQFSTFINPECKIPEEASKKNNITNEMVKDAPTFEKVFPDFYKFIEGSTLVAHNIAFDLPFISYYAKPLGYSINNATQDTMLIAQKHLGQLKHFNLKSVCDFLGISLVGAHRALNDTVATAKAFIKMMEKFQDQ